MANVRVAGTGLTAFGASPERTGRDLFAEASIAAFEDSGVSRDDVEAVFYGNFMGELAEHQGHQGPLMAEAAGVRAPATRFESACASSGVAVREAVKRIRTGENDVLLVGGAERMTNLGTAGATEALAIAADDLWEVRAGTTFPGAYALMAQAYFDAFGGDREDLAHIAVKNHDNALPNEKAQYQRAIEVDDVLEAPLVSEPLGLYDACPISDGASALLLTSEDYATDHDLEAPVAITGTGQGGDRMALHDREHLARSPAAREAGQEAYADAGIDAGDVDVAEVHDCFTIAEVLALEALDLEPIGEGISAARDGRTTADGELPVNLSGGLKAKGHPVGATGASQVAEMATLLAGTHPNSDHVADATTGVTHNAGGTVASAMVHVLEVAA
ncbi:beta-ketoacyl synthase N-terminal-like domain-containing protein [Natrinema hispanicum]|uniref:Acetyl-CoA C-acetyltransferase n=1 Tax=Natrinema hispanicum TaxID=392421 RepID=A0A1H9YLL0_9EURY|nr:beta-ketoacyl synthase N-terminal-like domain-containing protein [Natrinema hispanicum]SDC22528.1 acetyl-CoA C-acetyltransferase [Natrinema hispanicum]SES70003.1 acetyl-CoA C-acetyltransferase [Natrinema hispanicum]